LKSPGAAADDPVRSGFSSHVIKAGLGYFAPVFGAGFVLGSIRVPFLVPRFGERISDD